MKTNFLNSFQLSPSLLGSSAFAQFQQTGTVDEVDTPGTSGGFGGVLSSIFGYANQALGVYSNVKAATAGNPVVMYNQPGAAPTQPVVMQAPAPTAAAQAALAADKAKADKAASDKNLMYIGIGAAVLVVVVVLFFVFKKKG